MLQRVSKVTGKQPINSQQSKSYNGREYATDFLSGLYKEV